VFIYVTNLTLKLFLIFTYMFTLSSAPYFVFVDLTAVWYHLLSASETSLTLLIRQVCQQQVLSFLKILGVSSGSF
jgi:hypothetical protein